MFRHTSPLTKTPKRQKPWTFWLEHQTCHFQGSLVVPSGVIFEGATLRLEPGAWWRPLKSAIFVFDKALYLGCYPSDFEQLFFQWWLFSTRISLLKYQFSCGAWIFFLKLGNTKIFWEKLKHFFWKFVGWITFWLAKKWMFRLLWWNRRIVWYLMWYQNNFRAIVNKFLRAI